MIPFFQPYTAPDGTSRRPLVERVPECKPEGLVFSNEVSFSETMTAWRMKDDAAKAVTGNRCAYFGDAIASDLCCMAVIRWLEEPERMKISDKNVRWECLATKRHRADALDDANALNALAHAVADGMGIEK